MKRPQLLVQASKPLNPSEAHELLDALERWERDGGALVLPYYVVLSELPLVRPLHIPGRPRRWPSAVAHRAQRTIRCRSAGWYQARAALRTWH